jgi:hypothetical protein
MSETKSVKRILERDIEEWFCQALNANRIAHRRQVPCPAGIADVVTEHAIYEVKFRLTRNILFHAIGQLTAYRECINGKAELAVVYTHMSSKGDVEWLAKSANIKLIRVYGKGLPVII